MDAAVTPGTTFAGYRVEALVGRAGPRAKSYDSLVDAISAHGPRAWSSEATRRTAATGA